MRNITIEQLRARLAELGNEVDKEAAWHIAERALVEFINDAEVERLYDSIYQHYLNEYHRSVQREAHKRAGSSYER